MKNLSMGAVIVLLAVMAAIIVGIDVTIFKNHFWARFAANVGIVLLFAAFYLRYFSAW